MRGARWWARVQPCTWEERYKFTIILAGYSVRPFLEEKSTLKHTAILFLTANSQDLKKVDSMKKKKWQFQTETKFMS